MKMLFRLAFLNLLLLPPAFGQAILKEATDSGHSTQKAAEMRCVVDSGTFNSPYVKEPGGNHVSVPLPDGAQVSIFKSESAIEKIEISPGPRFRWCSDKTLAISDLDRAKSLLAFTHIENAEIFVGAELVRCYSIDEGWYFVLAGKLSYIGYAGPMEKPLAFVGMTCESN